MPTIAVLGEKGGAGKSTVAINVAAELAARGARVLLVDCDPQGTAIEWASLGAEAGHTGPRTIALGDNVRGELARLAEEHEWTIVDLPGRSSKRSAAAVMVADLALLPCAPSPLDAWALGSTVALLANARELRPELLVSVLVNKADRTTLAANTREAIEALGVPVLEATLGSRVAFAEAIASGQGVTAYAPGSVAADELRRLVDELEALLKLAIEVEALARGNGSRRKGKA